MTFFTKEFHVKPSTPSVHKAPGSKLHGWEGEAYYYLANQYVNLGDGFHMVVVENPPKTSGPTPPF